MRASREFGALEAVIMDRLWACDGATSVRDVFEELQATRAIAYTTVMSTMDNLHSKGWLERDRDGRAFRYWPVLSREEHSARLMRQALAGAADNPDVVFAHFVQEMTAEESAALRKVLDQTARGRSR